jgi:hypothetical protein
MKTILSLVMWLAMVYFGTHLVFFAIDLHKRNIERQNRPPIELRR